MVRDKSEIGIVPKYWAPEATGRRYRYHPCPIGSFEPRMQAERQSEVADKIGGELKFASILVARELGQRHDPGVVDETVYRAGPIRHEPANRCQVGNIKCADIDCAVADRTAQFGCDRLGRVRTPGRDGHGSPGPQ